MTAYLIITYDVSDQERYAEYNPGNLPGIVATVTKHNGEVIFGGPPEVLTGSHESNAVCIKFADADAAKAWLADEEYAPFKAIRMESTTNITEYIVPGRG